ncbi:tyrosine-type recombinase/integrase [Streptomyces sp. NEAU-sy36]|uniref:tyrosine-type recombinase/integrase n=1 Tax=Streptomyces sp. NEAU-sy36 TaxID=2751189 RepID=UPI00214B1C18|nr:tyrosine-type recombinase/integrase [Streptomyces sp. NEAU-sy36]
MTHTDIERAAASGLVLPATADLTAPAEFTPDVLAKLQDLEDRSRVHEQNSRPDNTRDSYAADWKHWETFCALLGLPVAAITPGSLTAFVEWLWVQPGWKPGTYTAPSTIDRRLSGVVVTGRTQLNLRLDKTVAARARTVLKAKVKEMEKTKEKRGRGPAPALLVEHLSQAVTAAPDNRLGIRNKSIALTQFAIAGREHEVAFLRLRDFEEHAKGLLVDVRVSKVKPRKVKVPFGTNPSTCPVRAWKAWKESAGLTDPDDFAYKPLHPRWHTVMDGGLDPETIGDVITKLGTWAELDFRPTGHSPRRGAATSAKRAGKDRKEIARQGGWADNSAAMETYFAEVDGWEENAMRGVL